MVANDSLERPGAGQGRMIAGVCAALAARFGVSRFLMRVAFVVAGFVGAGELVYIVLWIAIPRKRR